MPTQYELPGFDDLLPEAEAAAYVGLGTETLRDLRSGHWQGITPYRECGGEYFYRRTDLDGWLASHAKKKPDIGPGSILSLSNEVIIS